MTEPTGPENEDVDKAEAADPDVESDPARGEPETEVDWADEGGALPEGPATDTDD